MIVRIEKLARPYRDGDWHDAPLRWSVIGPAAEVQNFSTRKDARTYKRIRVVSPNFADAQRRFVREA